MLTDINPMLLIDGYKADHRSQYPAKTEYIYSNFTPRKSRVQGRDNIVFFGLQYFIKEYLIERFDKGFFEKPKKEVVAEYQRRMDTYLGPDMVTTDHIADLHDLGYLPLRIKALPEGTRVPMGVPVLTLTNTDPKFAWITNYIETLMSNILWKPCTSATTADMFKQNFEAHMIKTGGPIDFTPWQGHDFSFRGASGNEDAFMSGAAHLLSFTGTDTIPAIDFLERYYNANAEKELIGGSVPATEHSTMCAGGEENEIETFKRLITETYPKGGVSIVSDTWDFWKVITEYLPALKDTITGRDGRVVIRPDSGDPFKIICGDKFSTSPEAKKGAYEMLWDIFGGEVNKQGYKILHPSIGLIYGDSITLDKQKRILDRLELKGFSASNLVLGIGSYTYEYVTRDTYGFAMKATWCQVDGKGRDIFKDPKTDDGTKKSAKGLLQVYKEDGKLQLIDMCTPDEEERGELKEVFNNGKILETTLGNIRELLT